MRPDIIVGRTDENKPMQYDNSNRFSESGYSSCLGITKKRAKAQSQLRAPKMLFKPMCHSCCCLLLLFRIICGSGSYLQVRTQVPSGLGSTSRNRAGSRGLLRQCSVLLSYHWVAVAVAVGPKISTGPTSREVKVEGLRLRLVVHPSNFIAQVCYKLR